MTTYATSGRPVWAVTAWTDDNHVYVELPCTDGPPYITKYSLTENGLGKALGLMRSLHRKAQPTGGSYSFADHPKLAKPKAEWSESQRAAARNVLKRLKIT